MHLLLLHFLILLILNDFLSLLLDFVLSQFLSCLFYLIFNMLNSIILSEIHTFYFIFHIIYFWYIEKWLLFFTGIRFHIIYFNLRFIFRFFYINVGFHKSSINISLLHTVTSSQISLRCFQLFLLIYLLRF